MARTVDKKKFQKEKFDRKCGKPHKYPAPKAEYMSKPDGIWPYCSICAKKESMTR